VHKNSSLKLLVLSNFVVSGTSDSIWIVTAFPLVSRLFVSEQSPLKILPINYSG
jgi:hypothetical protein